MERIDALSKYFKAMKTDHDDTGLIPREIHGKPWTIEECAEMEKKITPEQIVKHLILFFIFSIALIVLVAYFSLQKDPESVCVIRAPMEQSQCRALFSNYSIKAKVFLNELL